MFTSPHLNSVNVVPFVFVPVSEMMQPMLGNAATFQVPLCTVGLLRIICISISLPPDQVGWCCKRLQRSSKAMENPQSGSRLTGRSFSASSAVQDKRYKIKRFVKQRA